MGDGERGSRQDELMEGCREEERSAKVEKFSGWSKATKL
jgi:hypothetical protein